MEDRPIETTLYSLSEETPSSVDRRDDERHLTLFRVGSLRIGERRELCLIKNVSAGGMMIRAYSALEPETRLSVELKEGQHVQGFVSWVEGNNAGIQFNARIDVLELLSASMHGPTPRMPRVEVRCIASVRQGSQVYGMLARDVSQGGIKVESDRPLDIGSDVVVTLPGLASQGGTVRWRHSGTYGIAFNRLLALSELVAWLQDQRETLAATGTN